MNKIKCKWRCRCRRLVDLIRLLCWKFNQFINQLNFVVFELYNFYVKYFSVQFLLGYTMPMVLFVMDARVNQYSFCIGFDCDLGTGRSMILYFTFYYIGLYCFFFSDFNCCCCCCCFCYCCCKNRRL